MLKNWTIRSVKPETRAKALILAASKDVCLAKLFEEVINQEFLINDSVPQPGFRRKLKQILARYPMTMESIVKKGIEE